VPTVRSGHIDFREQFPYDSEPVKSRLEEAAFEQSIEPAVLGLGERVRTLAWVQDPFRDHLLEQAIEESAGPSGGCGMGSGRETLHRNRERGDLTMIMRITWGRIHPGTWEEYEKTYNATVVAKSKNIKGLRGRWLAQDTADKDAGYSVSVWDSAEDMEAYEQSEFFKKEILAPLQPFHINAFTTTRCDVKYAQEFK
jgi:heme-degrading monooxygenase HmoA